MSMAPPPPPPPSMPPPPGAVPPPPPGGFGPGGFGAGGFPGGPTPYPVRPIFAGFWQRVAGYLLDGLLYGLVASVFAIPAVILGVNAFDDCRWIYDPVDDVDDLVCPPGSPDGGLLAIAILLGLLGVVVVAFLYLRALARTGQTWGRQIVGIRVVRTDNPDQPLGWGKAILRSLVEGIVSGNCILGYLWMLWDKQKQTWHDKIVSTYVVKV